MVAQVWIVTGGTAATLGPVDPQTAKVRRSSEADELDEGLVPASCVVPRCNRKTKLGTSWTGGLGGDSGGVTSDQIL